MSITTEQLEKMVRTLVWEDADEGMCTKWRAAALGGRYELVDLDKDGRLAVNFCWGRPLSFWFIQGEHDQFGPTGPKQFPTLEVAMAAAHADYAARVLAALDMDILAETFRPPPAELAAAPTITSELIAAHKRIAELEALRKPAIYSAAVIGSFYEWVERVEKAGGPTCISGIAECNAMIKSLRKNAKRADELVMKPLREAIAALEAKP